MNNYVLITSARNEETFIEKTIKSVIVQTILPKKWIIVSDGSTDRTDEIVEKYLSNYNFMVLLRKQSDENRNFGSKAKAISIAYNNLKELDFEFIGNLDADVSFDANYYKNIFIEFNTNSRLGIAGGVRYDLHKNRFKKLKCAPDSVGGPFQLFRRECYEEIGGYKQLQYGGIDAVAEITARMLGWQVESFTDIVAYHHRATGTAFNNVFKQKFRAGVKLYSIGYHPIFPIARYVARLFAKPIIIGGLISITGYFWAWFRGYNRQVSDSFIEYLRSEQKGRIRRWLSGSKHTAFRK